MAYTLDDLTDLPSGVYNRLKQKFVNLTKPDTEFADLPYEAQATSIERRQKLADLLQQQARSPIEIQSYKGIQAPIATTAGLSKVLDSIMAGYEEGDTATQAKEAAKAQEADTKYTLDEVEKATSPAYRTTPVTSGTLADIPGASTSAGPMTALPPGTSAPSVPNYDAQSEAEAESAGTTVGNLPQPAGYDPQAALANIPSAFGNRQPLDSGYTGLSGQSLQQGSHQDLVKALLHSKVTALRNAGLTMATTPEKLYTLARGETLQNAAGKVLGTGAAPLVPQGSFQDKAYDDYVTRTVAAGETPLPREKWVNANRPVVPKVPKEPRTYTVTVDGVDDILTLPEIRALQKAGKPVKIRAPNILQELLAGFQPQQPPQPSGWGTAATVPQAEGE
jgi:hypothetical protein